MESVGTEGNEGNEAAQGDEAKDEKRLGFERSQTCSRKLLSDYFCIGIL